MSNNGWAHKEDVYIDYGMITTHKKKLNSVFCNKMHATGNYYAY